MSLHHFFGQGQAQAAAYSRVLGLRAALVESLENMWQILRCDPSTTVRDGNFKNTRMRVRLHLHFDNAPFQAELQGVREQIVEDLFNPKRIGFDPCPQRSGFNQ